MKKLFTKYHLKWANEKVNLFLSKIDLPVNSLILDLGGRDGAYMERFKNKIGKLHKVLIADIDESSLEKARKIGYKTIKIDASSEKLPFKDSELDCIFCNSVIEHITIPKTEIWNLSNDFRNRSITIQKKFANEIRRCSKSYYVQTPHKYFPLEAHTWFPMIGFLPRSIQVQSIKLLNKFWFKKTTPDWNLLDEDQMENLFPDAEILVIKKWGFKKEVIAIKPFGGKLVK